MFYRIDDTGLTLFVRLTPKSALDKISGIEETTDGKQHLSVRVRAIPENGRANKALIKFLAKEFRVPASSIHVASGDVSRIKQLKFSIDIACIIEKLSAFSYKDKNESASYFND